jgi:hypothetical protein
MTRYIELLLALDVLAKSYPRYHNHEILLLADDIWKWLNNELPHNSSKLVYLKGMFASPSEAIRAVWKEIQLLAGPLANVN